MALKIDINDPKKGKTYNKEATDDMFNQLKGKKIGETVDGSIIGMEGYEFLITGGSDIAGFPMRKDIPGTGRKRILAVSGVGIKKKAKGVKQRKTVAGNTIYNQTAQINLKITKYGKEPLSKEAEETKGKEEKKETRKEEKEKQEQEKKEVKEKPKQEKKEEKVEKKKQEKKEEKKPEEKKEQVKKEEKKEKVEEKGKTEEKEEKKDVEEDKKKKEIKNKNKKE